MVDLLDTDTETDAEPEGVGADVEVCGIDGCTETFSGPATARELGTHRYRRHGIAGASRTAGKTKKKQPRGSPRVPAQPAASTQMSDIELATGIMELYMLLSMLFALRGDKVCGDAVVACADKAAAAWVRAARHNPELRKRLESIAGVSWLSLVIAHLPLIEAVRDHHVVPAFDRRHQRAAARQAERAAGGREDPARARYEEAMTRPQGDGDAASP